MLPPSHQEQIAADLRREWTLFFLVFAGIGLEMGLGLFLWSELRSLGAAPDRSGLAWILGFIGVTAVQLVAARWAHRRLLRPAPLLRRLREGLAEAGLAAPPPEELLTVVAIRATFAADVVAWILIQFITVYGLVALVLVSALAPLLAFGAVSAAGLALAHPRRARVEALAEALRREVGQGAGG